MSWLRDNMKIFIWITAIAFIVPFVAGTLIRNFMGPQGPRGTLATVNDRAITVESYQTIYDRVRERQAEDSTDPLTADEMDELRREAFREAVNQSIMQQTLEQEGAEATQSEIRQMFAQSPTFRNEQGRVNRRAVQRALQRMPEQRRKQIERSNRRRIETLRMTQWLTSQVDNTDTENRVLTEEGLRELDLYGIYVNPREFVDDDRVKTYYESNREQYRNDPQAFVRHILFRSDTSTRRTPQQLNDIKDKVETIRRRFRAGDSFEELARQFSEDTPTARKGGALGWVTPDELDQSFSNEVFGGDTQTLTGLIRTDKGYHLGYVEKGPKITYQDLSAVEAKIRNQLLSDTHWTQARRKITSLRKRVASTKNPLETLQELALVESHSEFTSSRAGHYGWVPNRFVLRTRHNNADRWREELVEDGVINETIAQTLARLKTGELSDVLRTDRGFHLFVPRAERSPDLATLSDTDTTRITRRLRSRKQSAYRNEWLRQKREQATVELNVPKSRIGGYIPWENNGE